MTRPIIVVLAPEPVRDRMAGMGIRALEMARALSREFHVRLVVPNDPSECPPAGGLEVSQLRGGAPGAREALQGAAGALVSGHCAGAVLGSGHGVPIAVDWYDPFLVENFRYRDSLGPHVEANDRRAWNLQLARGDFFLCASEEQRLFYAGMLVQGGRVGAAVFGKDPTLASLLAVVPFGAAEAEPADGGPVREAVGAGDAEPVLYFGGLYDWHDPDAILDGWEAILRRFPAARLIFSANPNPESTPQSAWESARARSDRDGLTGRSVFFLPWTPYGDRWRLYAAATLAVCSCRPGLETDLSYRTRLLDAAAAGLASVSLNGGALAREIEAAGGGLETGDAAAFRDAIEGYLADSARRERDGDRARRFARARSWESVVRPLSSFFRGAHAFARPTAPKMESGRRRLFGWSRR